MSRILYVDAIAGAAGDMLLAALIDAGADPERIAGGLDALGIAGLELEVKTVKRQGISARQVRVVAPDRQPHRRWAEVRVMLDQAALPKRVSDRADAVFTALARAEARVHDVAPQEVHFHEVGALDAIADVCGVALALEELEVEEIECSPLPAGRGFVAGAHGTLPLPAPAALELLRGVPVYGVDVDAELVTPTGAAILITLASRFGSLPAMRAEAIGYGAGSRELPALPNLVRAIVGHRSRPAHDRPPNEVVLIETNLDDLLPELVPDAIERSFAAGALDVWLTPVQMKKGRPGVVLTALARPGDEPAVAEAMLRQTSTLGVRVSAAHRIELDRSSLVVHVGGEPVRVKLGLLAGETVNISPEHDDCAAAAGRTGRTVKGVWVAALAAAQRQLEELECEAAN